MAATPILPPAGEQAGGRVVLNATEAGERSLWKTEAIPEPTSQSSAAVATQGHALTALAHDYLEHYVDVFQRPNTRLYAWLKPRLAARQVRGLVLWHYVGCDLWRAEAASLREYFGLPVLLLDADETSSGSARATG